MALYGSAVPWWRVVRADGALLPGHELRALDHYRAEGTPLREAPRQADGHLPRLDMRRARWDGGPRAVRARKLTGDGGTPPPPSGGRARPEVRDEGRSAPAASRASAGVASTPRSTRAPSPRPVWMTLFGLYDLYDP